MDRRLLFDATDALLADRWWLSVSWLDELSQTAGSPWDIDERRTLEPLVCPHRHRGSPPHDPPQAAVLRAVGYAPPDGSDQTSTT